MTADLSAAFGRIRILICDVDGVMTDGGIFVSDDGMQTRKFNVKDGLGLRCVLDCGVAVAFLSGSDAPAIRHRGEALGIDEILVGVADKGAAVRQLCRRKGVPLECVAFIGDDLNDLPAFRIVGLPIAPADAVEQVKSEARYVSCAGGGHGVVREVCDRIVRSREASKQPDR